MLTREFITPRDEAHWLELRKSDLTSTMVPALFGCSPYSTAFQLWHEIKHDLPSSFEDNERMFWGRHLESGIARAVGIKEEIRVAPYKDYIRVPELRLGSSFDYVELVETDDLPPLEAEGQPPQKFLTPSAIIEIKNVDGLQFKNGWKEDEDGNLEAPLHIEIQIQHQMLVSGINVCKLRALVGGNKVVQINRQANPEFQQMILAKCAAFWHSIDNNLEPSPNFAKDAEFITSLYKFVRPGLEVDGTTSERLLELAHDYKAAAEAIKQLEVNKQAAKAEMLTIIKDAHKVYGDGFSISAGEVKPTIIKEYERKGYRDFRIYMKKEK